MGKYYENQVKKEISSPPNEIAVLDSAYVFNGKLVFTMEHHSIKKPSFIFKNANGTPVYTADTSLTKTILYDFKKNPILNVRNSGMENYKFYTGKKTDTLLGETHSKNSLVAKKLSVSCKNIATESEQILDMNSESYYRSCGIFVGKEKENAPMICKILKMKKSIIDRAQYTIEIAPGVDYVFMLALSIIFIDKYETLKRKKRNNH